MKAIDALCRETVVIRLSNEVSESGWPGTGHKEIGPPLSERRGAPTSPATGPAVYAS